MPTKRILLTLQDVKTLVSKKYKVSPTMVENFDNDEIEMQDYVLGASRVIGPDDYIFQIDTDVK